MKRQIVIGPDTKIARLGGRPPRGVLILLVLQIGLFLLYAFADGPPWVAIHIAASTEQCLGRFELWQPLTALWIHLGTRNLLTNMLGLWIFGSALERWWGIRRFLLFWIVTGVVGLVLGVLVGMLQPKVVLAGSDGSAMAMMIAVGVIFPRHMVFFFGLLPLKARILSLSLAAFLVLGNLLGGHYLELAVQTGGVLVALAFLFPTRQLMGQMEIRRAKRKFKVIEGGKKGDKRYLN